MPANISYMHYRILEEYVDPVPFPSTNRKI
jgi:hypothetical protein